LSSIITFTNKKTNVINSEKSKKEVINEPNENKGRQSSVFKQSTAPSAKAQLETYDNSPKNLADFFNGEIIDLDE